MAPMIIAKADVLKGKKGTADLSAGGFMESRGWAFTGQSVTGQPGQVSGKGVTAEGSKYAERFANALIEALEK